MPDLEYEHSNKEVLEKCCQVMNVKAVAVKAFKKTKLKTRRRIEELKAIKELNDRTVLSI